MKSRVVIRSHSRTTKFPVKYVFLDLRFDIIFYTLTVALVPHYGVHWGKFPYDYVLTYAQVKLN